MSSDSLARPAEVFLSHSGKDQEIASRLVKVLRGHGVPVFFSPHNILGAAQWHDEIGKALLRCDWFIVLLSPEAVASTWVKHEVVFAISDRRFLGRVIPLLHRECDQAALSWTLPQLQRVDFSDDFSRGCRELLRIWGIGLRDELLGQSGETR